MPSPANEHFPLESSLPLHAALRGAPKGAPPTDPHALALVRLLGVVHVHELGVNDIALPLTVWATGWTVP